MHIPVLGFTDVIVNVGIIRYIFGWGSCFQLLLDAANARLAPFHLGHLLDKSFAICSKMPCFGATVFKFTLQKTTVSQSHEYMGSEGLFTVVVL
jgi:hypothetical protein